MAIEKISDYLYVSKQLDERTVKRIAQFEDVKTVICNRPDGEEPNQPSFATVKQWFNDAGIENVYYLPVTLANIADDAVLREFQATIAKSPAPILAYCRTGTRSALLWALNQAKRGVEVNSLIKAAELAGVDLSRARDKLEAVYAKRG